MHAKQISFREGKDEKGPLALAGAGTYKAMDAPEGAKEGRYVVCGSTDFLANAILGFNGNKDLFLNMMNWLSSDEDLISIRPKDPEDRGVNLSGRPDAADLLFLAGLRPAAGDRRGTGRVVEAAGVASQNPDRKGAESPRPR